MRRLLSTDTAPPVDGEGHSYRYVFPEDAFIAVASDYYTWRDRIKEHALGNGIPVPDMAVCEDQLCGTLPPDRCSYESGDLGPVNIEFTYNSVISWIKAVILKTVTGVDYVDQAEADRRAAICVRCPLNTQVSSGCGGGCEKLAEMMTPGMMKRSTLWDDKLKSCAVCSCFNRIQVHFPLEVLNRDDTTGYPVWCWKK